MGGENIMHRRHFLKNSAVSMATLQLGGIISLSINAEARPQKTELKRDFVWLFNPVFQEIDYQLTLHVDTYTSMHSKQIFKWRETSTI